MARKNTNLPYIYRGNWSGSARTEPHANYCAATSYGGGWNHQCSNKPKYAFSEEVRDGLRADYEASLGSRATEHERGKLDGLVGYGFCHMHNPVNIVANKIAEDAEREAATAKYRLDYAREQAADAVKKEAIGKASLRLEALGLTLPYDKYDVQSGDHIVNVRLSTLDILLALAERGAEALRAE